jgi:hypothetical protein
MSSSFLTVVVVPTNAVVVALFVVMWLGHRSSREAAVAIAAGTVVAVWAAVVGILAARGVFVQPVHGELLNSRAFLRGVATLVGSCRAIWPSFVCICWRRSPDWRVPAACAPWSPNPYSSSTNC